MNMKKAITLSLINAMSITGLAYAADMASPPNSLVVDDLGKVGVGTAAPANPLHVVRSDGSAQLKISETSGGNNVRTLFNLDCQTCTPAFRFKQASTIWFFRMLQSGDFSVDYTGQGGTDFVFKQGGSMKIGGTLTEGSSRTIKQNIEAIDPQSVLEKVAALPVNEWSYKRDAGRIRHIGPMAEDFHAAFGVGDSPQGLASLDTGGVALAAIQGLNAQLQVKEKDITTLQAQNLELSQRIEKLEQVLESLAVEMQVGMITQSDESAL